MRNRGEDILIICQEEKKKGCPVIGDRVWIGPEAVVVGGIYIGDNVLIAGNAFVNSDVPSNSIVMGNPGEIIPSPDATKDYITNVYKEYKLIV